MQTITLTKIYTTDKDKNGNPLISKNNKPYTRMSIQCNEYGSKWISGFKNAVSKSWKEGDKVEIIVKENGQYLNFDTPRNEEKLKEELDKIFNILTRINLDVQVIKEHMTPQKEQGRVPTSEGLEYPEEDINPEDIPF